LVFVVMLLMAGAVRPVFAIEGGRDDGKAVQSSLGVRNDFDSNIYKTTANEVESWIGIVSPAIRFSTHPERYKLLYKGEYGRFFEQSDDNYDDHAVSGVAQFWLGSHARGDFTVATKKAHERRGSGRTEGFDPASPSFPAEPDEFDLNEWEGNIRYGVDGNRGRLRFGIGGSQRDYTNNRERNRFFDYGTQLGSVGLSLLFSKRTAVVIDAVFTDISYQSDRPGEASLDGDDRRYLIGLTWVATTKVVGSIRGGIQERRFDDPARTKTSNPSWDVNLRWSPREYSNFDFVTSRLNEETTGSGEFIDTTAYSVTWNHRLSSSLESTISLALRDIKYVGSDQDEDLREFKLGLRYSQGRLLKWTTGYTRQSRDSSISNFIYDSNIFSIGVGVSI
jgi:hypothetical protein